MDRIFFFLSGCGFLTLSHLRDHPGWLVSAAIMFALAAFLPRPWTDLQPIDPETEADIRADERDRMTARIASEVESQQTRREWERDRYSRMTQQHSCN